MKTPLALKKHILWMPFLLICLLFILSSGFIFFAQEYFHLGIVYVRILIWGIIFFVVYCLITNITVYVMMRLRYRYIKNFLNKSDTEATVLVTKVREMFTPGNLSHGSNGEVESLLLLPIIILDSIYEVEAEALDKTFKVHFAAVTSIKKRPEIGDKLTVLMDVNNPDVVCLK